MNKVEKVFDYLFSEIIQKKFEKFILFLATAGFIIHLLLIYLNMYEVINFTFNFLRLSDKDFFNFEHTGLANGT